MLERDVRFVQLFHEAWDQHNYLVQNHTQNCLDTDQPVAALLQDLKDRDMLKDTLVIWGGEFGRTPMIQNPGDDRGRDHHKCGLHHMDGRRRGQGGLHLRRYR